MEIYTIGIIVDRTGSVILEKKMIEDSIEIITEALNNNYSQKIKKEIIVTCIGKEDILLSQQIKRIKPKEEVSLKNLLERENIFELFEKISNSEGIKKIFLYSDGYFKIEDWDKFISNLKNNEKFSEIERVSIGIGEGVNKTLLKNFSSEGKVFQYKDIFDLV